MGNNAGLVERAHERRWLLKAIEEFLGYLVTKRVLGRHRIIRHTSYNTHSKWELARFHGFWFEEEFGVLSWNGNVIRIWYDPRSGASRPDIPCMEFHWMISAEDPKTKVISFLEEEGSSWLPALVNLMENIDEILYEDAEEKRQSQEGYYHSSAQIELLKEMQGEAIRLTLPH